MAGTHHVAVICSDDERTMWFPYLVGVGATVLQPSLTWANW
jgi:hypothetical protein